MVLREVDNRSRDYLEEENRHLRETIREQDEIVETLRKTNTQLRFLLKRYIDRHGKLE